MDESETKKKERKNVRGKKRPTFQSSELVADMGIEDGLCNAAFDLFLLWQTLQGTGTFHCFVTHVLGVYYHTYLHVSKVGVTLAFELAEQT